jgi:hypothetical protein
MKRTAKKGIFGIDSKEFQWFCDACGIEVPHLRLRFRKVETETNLQTSTRK